MTETKKATAIESLLKEAAEFDESLFAPGNEVGKKDTVVGDCPPHARKLFALMRYYSRELEQAALDHKYENDHSRCDTLVGRMSEIKDKKSLLHDLFWFEVQTTLNLWQEAVEFALGVRRDWKIVKNPRTDNPLMELIRQMNE